MSVNAHREDRQFLPFVIRSQQSTRKAWPIFVINKRSPKRWNMPYRRDSTLKRWNMPYRRDSGTLKSIPYSLLQYQLIEQPREKLGHRGVMYEE